MLDKLESAVDEIDRKAVDAAGLANGSTAYVLGLLLHA